MRPLPGAGEADVEIAKMSRAISEHRVLKG